MKSILPKFNEERKEGGIDKFLNLKGRPTLLTMGESGKENVISSDKGKKFDLKQTSDKQTISIDDYWDVV